MKVELRIPTDRAYAERLFDCYDIIKDKDDHKSKRLRSFIIEECRRLRAKYDGNPRVDLEAIIEHEDNSPMEKPLYQNTKLDKYKVARFDPTADATVDRVAKLIRSRDNGQG